MPMSVPVHDDVLDRPVWHALRARQAERSIGDERALRFAPDYGPFAASADDSTGCLAALAELAGTSALWLIERDAVTSLPGLELASSARCLQMVASTISRSARELDVVELGDEDAGEMLALAALTEPGPFGARTHSLGQFVGVKHEGRLVAMAGERLKPGTFTELSGVCTHPDWRGRGYAGHLMRMVASRILDRGDRPFLHCYASNTNAIALYEGLGFRPYQTVVASVFVR
jgi:predicted GNAT family acetyltransferase